MPVAGLLVALAGCNTTGCIDNQSSLPLAGLYSSASGEQVTVSGIEIHGVGAPGDSLLVGATESVSQVYLPMRSASTSVSWCLHYEQPGIDSDADNDTITFYYSSEAYFASEECGAMYRYFIERCAYTTHLVDSVVVTDSLVTNVNLERIRIYFRTAPAQSGDDAGGAGNQTMSL